MARHVGLLVGVMLLGVATGSAAAPCDQQRGQDQKPQGQGRHDSGAPPPWKWWINPDSRKDLGITDQQSAEIEQIFESTMESQRSNRRDLEQLEAELAKTIKEGTADVPTVTQQAEKVERLRAQLTTARTVMLYRINRVLTPEQRVKVDAIRAKWEESHRKQQPGKGGR